MDSSVATGYLATGTTKVGVDQGTVIVNINFRRRCSPREGYFSVAQKGGQGRAALQTKAARKGWMELKANPICTARTVS